MLCVNRPLLPPLPTTERDRHLLTSVDSRRVVNMNKMLANPAMSVTHEARRNHERQKFNGSTVCLLLFTD